MTTSDETDAAPAGPLVVALDVLASACMVVAGVMLVALISLFGWLVFGRYVLNDTPTWIEQVALVLVVWITFLGAAAGVRSHVHLSLEFLRDGLPAVPRLILTWLAGAGMLIFGGFMAWQGWAVMISTWDRSIPMLGAPQGIRAMPMMICGALIVVFTLADLAGQGAGHRLQGR